MEYISKLGRGNLASNETLFPDEWIQSPNKRFKLTMQKDGNLVLYLNLADGSQRPLWASGTDGSGTNRCIMQKDGNLVLYTPSNDPTWASLTYDQDGSRLGSHLEIQNTGDVSIYTTSHISVWHTNTTMKIFISHSSKELPFVQKLQSDLTSNNIPYHMLPLPGDPDWEQSIRQAIKSSQAVIYIASPDAAASRYTRSELALASSAKITIFPFWANGEIWADCIPLGMTYTQYIDARGALYANGLQHLLEQLWP